MLTLDLALLEREGSLSVEGVIPPDAPLWEESEIRLASPLAAKLQATSAGSGEVVVTGRLTGVLANECRRCLKPVDSELDLEVVMVFGDRSEDGDEGGEIHLIPDLERMLELDEAVREELLLNADRFVECDPGCRGLCPRCGINRNEKACECTLDEHDPRWDALRALKSE